MSDYFREGAYAIPVRSRVVAADFPGFTFDIMIDRPGKAWNDFVHRTDEFVVVADGEIEIQIAAEKRLCNPGDLALIPARVIHSLRTSAASGSRWYYGYGRFAGADG